MGDKTLILALHTPAELYIGADGDVDGVIMLGGVQTCSGFPPWAAAADLLVRRDAGELCGVSYPIPPEHHLVLDEWVASLDPRCAQVVNREPDGRLARYAGLSAQTRFLEFRWSLDEPDEIAPAQLGGDLWYYRDEIGAQRLSLPTVVGYGIGDLQEILEEYDLSLPARLAVPRTLRVAVPGPTDRTPARSAESAKR